MDRKASEDDASGRDQLMLSEIFQKPKPVIGTVQLLPLPASPGWNGRMEPCLARAEQEVTAFTSGGVDGILLENTYDTPYLLDRIDPAGAIAMALIAKHAMQFSSLPFGLSVLGNDPESALAIAVNIQAPFIRVPVLVGGVITDTGMAEGKLQSLVSYKQKLKPLMAPRFLVDISLNHFVPGRIQSLMGGAGPAGSPGSPGGPARGFLPSDFLVNHLKQVATTIEKYDLAHGLILSGKEVTPQILRTLKEATRTPIFIEDPVSLEQMSFEKVPAYEDCVDGFILTESVKKPTIAGLDPRPSVDLMRVEEFMQSLAPGVGMFPGRG